jgi:ADP-ribose pyrophosphatase YjhB (NUDIX family)
LGRLDFQGGLFFLEHSQAEKCMFGIRPCGILILNNDSQLLVVRRTGEEYWNVPRTWTYRSEPDGTAILRATRELTGIEVPSGELQDLGSHRSDQPFDLHLYCWRPTSLAPDICGFARAKQPARFRPEKRQPAAETFRWVDIERMEKLLSPQLTEAIFPLVADPAKTGEFMRRCRARNQAQWEATLAFSAIHPFF